MKKRSRDAGDYLSGSRAENEKQVYKLCFAGISVGESKFDTERAAGALIRAVKWFLHARKQREDSSKLAHLKLVLMGPVISPFVTKVKQKAISEKLDAALFVTNFGALSKVSHAFALGVGTSDRWLKPSENLDNVELHKAGMGRLLEEQFDINNEGLLDIGQARVVNVPEGHSIQKHTGTKYIVLGRGPVMNPTKPGFAGDDYATNGSEVALEAVYSSLFQAMAARADELEQKRCKASTLLNQAKKQKKTRSELAPSLIDALHKTSRIGLGTLGIGVDYPKPRIERKQALLMLVESMKSGICFFDTADTYGKNGNDLHYVENLLRDALAEFEKMNSTGATTVDDIIIASKAGMDRKLHDTSSRSWVMPRNLTGQELTRRIEASFLALGGARPIGLWQLHHCPPEEGKLLELMQAAHSCLKRGFIDRLGLCNATLAQVKLVVNAGIPLSSVQNELSAWDRRNAKDTGKFGGVVNFCQEKHIAFIAIKTFGGTSFRNDSTSFKGLLERYPSLESIASAHSVSPFALWLAYSLKKWQCLVHVPGSTSVDHMFDCQRAKNLDLSHKDMLNLARVFGD